MAQAMTGKLSAAEARLMVAEKQLAAVHAQHAFMAALLKGEAASAFGAYFDVYHRAVESNRNRLGRRRWRPRWCNPNTTLGAIFFGALVFMFAQWGLAATAARAQEIDFGKIENSMTWDWHLQVGAAPKTIIDDGELHTVVLTIWEADAEAKVYWTSPDCNVSRTTIVPGKGIQTFQTAGELKLEATGEPNHMVQYGYVLLHLRTNKTGI